jgi:hypothetical protein
MANFLTGLCLVILGFGAYQFSHLFGLYPAQDKKGTPTPYLVLLIVSFSLMGIGAVMLVIGLL